jgi:hypothetical protein
LSEVAVIVEVALLPDWIVREPGEEVSEKSGVVTITLTVTMWFGPLPIESEPLMETTYVPAWVPVGTIIVAVEVPILAEVRSIELGAIVAQLFAPVPTKLIIPLYPLRAVAVIVVVKDEPAWIVNIVGEVVREKSGPVAGAKFVVSGLPNPVARS